MPTVCNLLTREDAGLEFVRGFEAKSAEECRTAPAGDTVLLHTSEYGPNVSAG